MKTPVEILSTTHSLKQNGKTHALANDKEDLVLIMIKILRNKITRMILQLYVVITDSKMKVALIMTRMIPLL